MIPENQLIDKLRNEKKKFDEIADKDFKNLFVAREVSNNAFLEKLNGQEKTRATDPIDKVEKEYTLKRVEVKRGSMDDVVGVQLEWQ